MCKRTLQEFLHDPTFYQYEELTFGDHARIDIKIDKRDLEGLRNRLVLNVMYVKVDEEHQRKGMMTFMLKLIATMANVDYLRIDNCMGSLQDILPGMNFTQQDPPECTPEAPSYFIKPRKLLGIVPY